MKKFFYLLVLLSLLFAGCEKTIEPASTIPEVITLKSVYVSGAHAEIGGQVVKDGGSPVLGRGLYFGPEENPEISGTRIELGQGTGTFSTVVIDLMPATTYYVKAYAFNEIGSAYGDQVNFSTEQFPPEVTTYKVTRVTEKSAALSGIVWQWGGSEITERGFYWNTHSFSGKSGQKISSEAGMGDFTCLLNGLEADTRYFYKAYAVNSVNETVGNEETFRTAGSSGDCFGCETGTFIDGRDAAVYGWVRINEQYWMAENLGYLPSVNLPSQISSSEPRYYVSGYFGTDAEEAKTTGSYDLYGVLYNWTAALNGDEPGQENADRVQGVCPDGWHLPGNADWDDLIYFLGGAEVAGYHLKNTSGWGNEEQNGDNKAGFAVLPAGNCVDGEFNGAGISGSTYFWSADAFGEDMAWFNALYDRDSLLFTGPFTKDPGLSVRCIKD